VEAHQNVSQWAIDLPSAINRSQPVNLTTDASLTGTSGILSQGTDLKTMVVIAFWSGKFNSAQQNYPVHEQELLVIVESLKRFQHLLIGFQFHIFTDHKGLEWISTQSKLSPRQAQWLEVLSEFNFDIKYVPGEDNVLADALSHIYSNKPKGTIRSASEYMSVEEEDIPRSLLLNFVTTPLYTGPPLFLGATEACRSARIALKQINGAPAEECKESGKPGKVKARLARAAPEVSMHHIPETKAGDGQAYPSTPWEITYGSLTMKCPGSRPSANT
jgi:hypothetical protein